MSTAFNPALAERIRAVREATSAEALLRATRALAASEQGGDGDGNGDGDGDAEAIACLVEVLGFNNPGAAVAAVDGLIRRGPAAVETLLNRLDPRNYGARAWAVRALAGIGDVRGLPLLEEALASDVGPSVRRAAACGLGRLRLAELAEAERSRVRERALRGLMAGCADGEWVVRYAVAVGLESLAVGMQPEPPQRTGLLAGLERLGDPAREDTPVVRLRARLALRRLLEEQP